MYIYQLPIFERLELCRILDQKNKWQELGIIMQYNVQTLKDLRRMFRSASPTEELLTMWGNQNHTVTELYRLLLRIKHYEAARVIKHLVEGGDVETAGTDHSQLLQPRELLPLDDIAPNTPTESDISCIMKSARAMREISYEELRQSTNNWHLSTVLGIGGFGTVFRGMWRYTEVAIKRMQQSVDVTHLITELYCLNAYRHDNVLPLYGYSIDGSQPCLVYQYMPGRCLDDRLRIRDCDKVLKWHTRLDIVIGTARGLQFLHTIGEIPLIHGDIKSSNILLDSNDTPRIGDFGLAREGPSSNCSYFRVSKIHGTLPYLPHEYLRSKKLSTKVDTYSFGVVLFEIATALGAFADQRENAFLRDHVTEYKGDILDLKDMRAANGEQFYAGMIEIGERCVRKRAAQRPEMVEVLLNLESLSAKIKR